MNMKRLTGVSPIKDYEELKKKCRDYYKKVNSKNFKKAQKVYYKVFG